MLHPRGRAASHPYASAASPLNPLVGRSSPDARLSVVSSEDASQRRWYWCLILSSAASLVLCMLELLLSVHLLLDDTWSTLNVFVLQMLVYVLIALAVCGLVLAVLGLWVVAFLVEAHTLLGLPPPPKLMVPQRKARKDTSGADEENSGPLLTDAAMSPATVGASTVTLSHDDSIVADVHEEDATFALRAALRDPDVSPPPPAVSAPVATSSVVNVQHVQVQVHQGRSLNSEGAGSAVINSASAYGSHPTPTIAAYATNALADSILSSYLNHSVLLLILFFGFAVLLLAMRQQVADYVHSSALSFGIAPSHHAHGIHHNFGVSPAEGSDEVEDPEQAALALRTQLAAYLAVMGVCAIFSSKLMSFGTIAAWQIQRQRPFTQQAYLLSHLTTGFFGCVLISIRVYILHHQTFVPVHAGELDWLGVVGSLVLVASFAGLARFYAWTPRVQLRVRSAHMAALGLLAILLLMVSGALWTRTKQGKFYGDRADAPSASSPLRAIDVNESLWDLELTAQLKIGLLSITVLVTAMYTSVAAVLARQLDDCMLTQKAPVAPAPLLG